MILFIYFCFYGQIQNEGCREGKGGAKSLHGHYWTIAMAAKPNPADLSLGSIRYSLSSTFLMLHMLEMSAGCCLNQRKSNISSLCSQARVSFYRSDIFKDLKKAFSDKQATHTLHLRPIDGFINSHLLSLSSIFAPPNILCIATVLPQD